MNDKGANIDLLFRNGLKDFEVLPPADVWDGIRASGKVKSRSYLFLRIAAVVIVLLSVSFLTFRLSRELTDKNAVAKIAVNTQPSAPSVSNLVVNRESLASKPSGHKISPSLSLDATDQHAPVIQQELADLPDQIPYFNDNRSLSLKTRESSTRYYLSPLKSTAGKSTEIKYADLQYMPDKIAKPVNRWSIGAMASPTYYSSYSSGSDEFSKQLTQAEQPLISISGGVAFSYKISKRFSIQSGIYYSSLGQRVDGINSFSGFKPYDNSKGDYNFEVLTSAGTVQASNPDVFLNANGPDRIVTAYTKDVFDPKKASLQYINNSLTQSLSYLELPVFLRYKVIDKTIGINVIGGLSYNLLVHNSVYTTIDGSKYPIGDTKGLNPFVLSSSLGMGMEYNFSEKISLNLEPTFRYYLNTFSVTNTFIHPYSFGIFSGFLYKF